MGVFIKSSRLLPSFRVPSIPTTISVDMFFDRTDVKNALSAMEYRSLTKASLLVRRTAQRSIRKMGLARPKLVEQTANPRMNLSQILSRTTNKRRQAIIIERIRQIKTRPPSAPGTPPHTHVPGKSKQSKGHAFGLRNIIWNGYDKSTHSAVAGPPRKGPEWTIPKLHEFGGAKTLRQWVFVPKYPRYTKPIVKWVGVRENPGDGWVATGVVETKKYPARPYMAPALTKSRPRLAKMFEGQFSAGVGRG